MNLLQLVYLKFIYSQSLLLFEFPKRLIVNSNSCA